MQLLCTFKRLQLLTMVISAAAVVTVLMILFFFNYPTIARDRVIEAMVFRNNTESMDRFMNTSDIKNLRATFYIYNITNPDKVVGSAAKINLTEIGPFVYDEYREKELVDNNQTLGLITYKLRRRYVFNRNLSVSDPTKVMITWPNVPLIVARSVIDKLPYLERTPIYWFLNSAIKSKNEPPFITDTAANFLFNGSKRNFFEYLQSLDKMKVLQPWPLPDNMFGLLYNKNFTWNPLVDREMTVKAGLGLGQTYRDLNQFAYINGSSVLSFWRDDPKGCNIVGGTDGEFFSPFLDQSGDLQVYAPDICRKLTMKPREATVVAGVSALKYTLDPKCLQSGENNPDNQCYCLSRNADDSPKPECFLDGLIDLSSCVQPNVVASGAHFIHGSDDFLARLSGISAPNASIHDPVLIIEPNTGVAVKAHVPIQINVRLEKGGFNIFNFFKDDEPLILPLIWTSESSELTPEQGKLLSNKLLLLNSWLATVILGGAVLFIIMIIIFAIILFSRYRVTKNPRTEPSEEDPLLTTPTSRDE